MKPKTLQKRKQKPQTQSCIFLFPFRNVFREFWYSFDFLFIFILFIYFIYFLFISNFIIRSIYKVAFFCFLLEMFSVNFDIRSIAFLMYLLNGVPFQFCCNTWLPHPLSLDGFPNATTLLSLSFKLQFIVNNTSALFFCYCCAYHMQTF